MPHTIPDMATIALAATDGMLHFELAMACEVFVRDPSGLADPWYHLVVCGDSPVRIGRFRMEPDDGLDRLARADTVIIPAVEDIDAEVPPDLLDAVRAAHDAGARIVSLCAGAFVLAAAGTLWLTVLSDPAQAPDVGTLTAALRQELSSTPGRSQSSTASHHTRTDHPCTGTPTT
jgi:putative intracellular protease/amidase